MKFTTFYYVRLCIEFEIYKFLFSTSKFNNLDREPSQKAVNKVTQLDLLPKFGAEK